MTIELFYNTLAVQLVKSNLKKYIIFLYLDLKGLVHGLLLLNNGKNFCLFSSFDAFGDWFSTLEVFIGDVDLFGFGEVEGGVEVDLFGFGEFEGGGLVLLDGLVLGLLSSEVTWSTILFMFNDFFLGGIMGLVSLTSPSRYSILKWPNKNVSLIYSHLIVLSHP